MAILVQMPSWTCVNNISATSNIHKDTPHTQLCECNCEYYWRFADQSTLGGGCCKISHLFRRHMYRYLHTLATYSCDPGYNLTECNTTEYLSSGSWSCDPPFCAGIKKLIIDSYSN